MNLIFKTLYHVKVSKNNTNLNVTLLRMFEALKVV